MIENPSVTWSTTSPKVIAAQSLAPRASDEERDDEQREREQRDDAAADDAVDREPELADAGRLQLSRRALSTTPPSVT